jgi:hypothetical protein
MIRRPRSSSLRLRLSSTRRGLHPVVPGPLFAARELLLVVFRLAVIEVEDVAQFLERFG